MYAFLSKVYIIPPKKQVVKIRKTETDFDSDGGKQPHLPKTANIAHIRCK